MRRALVMAGIVLVLVAGGAIGYARLRPRPVAARADPAVTVASAIAVLQRSGNHPLTKDQTATILPLLRVLRDTDPNDAEVSRALGREILSVFTPAQRDEIERAREEARAQRQVQGAPGQRAVGGPGGPQAGPGGVGTPGGFGPLGTGAARGAAAGRSRTDVRQRLLTRLIERLEQLQ